MDAAQGHKYDLFISFADADRAWVHGVLLDYLERGGVSCLTQDGFRLGAAWTEEFERAVAESARVLLVLSRAYSADLNQQFLSQIARYHELGGDAPSVIPLLRERVVMPLGLEAKVRLEATTEEQQASALERLVRACRGTPPGPPEAPPCPYPGMAPFGRDDAARFRGRDRDIEDILQQLRHRPCLFLSGPSGCGKSSLVFAGLLPRLEKEKGWAVREMRPGRTPAATLAGLTEGADSPRLLVVDQLEELFSKDVDPAEAARFAAALTAQIHSGRGPVLVTVRSDFYPELEHSPLFPLFDANHWTVRSLTEEGLREAIVGPAEAAGVFVERDLVERLVADAAGEPGVLPHVQETLQLLWKRLRRRLLPLDAYLELGRDGRTGLEQAMAVVADAALDGLSPEEQGIARRVFLRLVQFGEGRGDTRRQQPWSAVEEAHDGLKSFAHVMGRLVQSRLLVVGQVRTASGDEATIDLAHEALIAGWPRLRQWIEEGRAAETTRRRLNGRADEWVRLGRGGGGLLDEVELGGAEEWLSRYGGEMGAGADLRAYVRASADKIKAARSGAVRRVRNTMVGLIAGAALAAGLAIWAVVIADGARRDAHVANAGLTQRAWEQGDVDYAVNLLDRQQPRPWFFWGPDLRGFEWYHWWKVCHRARSQVSHDFQVWAVAFADDQTLLSATGEYNQPVQAGSSRINADGCQLTITEIDKPKAREENVTALAFSPHNSLLAVATFTRPPDRGFITVWDPVSSKQKGRVPHRLNGKVNCLAFSADGALLAAGVGGSEAQVWTTNDYKPVRFDEPLPQSAQALAFYGQRLLAVAFREAGGDKVQLFDAVTGKADKTGGSFTAPAAITTLAFSNGGRTLAAGNEAGAVYLWDLPSGAGGPAALIPSAAAARVTCLAFSPGGPLLAVGSADHKVRLWRFPDAGEAELQDDTLMHSQAVRSLAFNPDGTTLASGGDDRKVKLWAVARDKALDSPNEKHAQRIQSLAFSADGKTLATGSLDDTAALWDVDTARRTHVLCEPHNVNAVAFTPDGALLVSGIGDRAVNLWDAAGNFKTSVALPKDNAGGQADIVFSMAFAPKGAAAQGTLAVGTGDGAIRLFRCEGGTLVPTRERRHAIGQDRPVYALAWSPREAMLAAGGADGRVKLWDADLSGSRELPVPPSAPDIWSVAFSPDGSTLAAGSSDSVVRLWDAKTAALKQEFPDREQGDSGHHGFVNGVAFSPDGDTLASTAQDGLVILWNLRTGRPHAKLPCPGKGTAVAFAPARRPGGRSPLLASASGDGDVRFWRAAEHDPPSPRK